MSNARLTSNKYGHNHSSGGCTIQSAHDGSNAATHEKDAGVDERYGYESDDESMSVGKYPFSKNNILV